MYTGIYVWSCEWGGGNGVAHLDGCGAVATTSEGLQRGIGQALQIRPDCLLQYLPLRESAD